MKKVMFIFAVMALALGARAESYLYWMLDEPTPMPFYCAVVCGVTDEDVTQYLMVADPTSGSVSDVLLNANHPELGKSLDNAYFYAVIPNDVTWKSFYIELYNENSSVVGVSQSAAYADLVEKFVYSDMGTAGVGSPYHFTAAIPEPSGGLLVLIGFGLMALRRKRSL